MIFLFWLGCGTSYRVLSQVFHVPLSTVGDIVNSMRDDIVHHLMQEVIKFPQENELQHIGLQFGLLANSAVFNTAVGAIDGCHVKVMVAGPNKNEYYNRKCDFSIQFQAIVDHEGKFLNIYAGYPGSVHDSRVLRASSVYRESKYPPHGYFILGDGGYPLLQQPICLVTPYRNPDQFNNVQNVFNTHHSRARSIVERAFGMLKVRWRSIFQKTVEMKHTKVARLITACAIMHNICVTLGDVLQPPAVNDEEQNDIVDIDNGVEICDAEFRNHLARRLQLPDVML